MRARIEKNIFIGLYYIREGDEKTIMTRLRKFDIFLLYESLTYKGREGSGAAKSSSRCGGGVWEEFSY